MASPKDTNDVEKSEIAQKEETILADWDKGAVFKKVLAKESPLGEFVFYEGPPTANGRPGIHHLISRAFKDAIPRYKTMRGFHVRRKAGWDTHGLPVEIETEKQLGFTNKSQIEEYGIAAFNEKCKESVWKYVNEWKDFTRRIGYWVDLDDAYVTYYPNYIESIWNLVKTISDRKLLYRDYKVLPWCPRCGTALSSHELAQGYQDVKDLSVHVKFKLDADSTRKLCGQDADNVYLLAWTTTPWTLPGNVALAVGEDIEYVKIYIPKDFDFSKVDVKTETGTFIFARDRHTQADLHKLYWMGSQTEYGCSMTFMKGKDLVGLSYEPPYDFLHDRKVSPDEKEAWDTAVGKAWKVYPASFVNTTEGTGIVHTAVMYGQDDFELGNKVGLPKYHLVDETGRFIEGLGFLSGRFVREQDENGKPTLAVDIIDDLKTRELFFNQENYKHSYPHCWRCKTPLIYYARTSWYIRMSELRDTLVKENEKINWVPEHIREGRFGEWLREVKDWAISRDRYWGTPLPVWRCAECESMHTIGSIDELLEAQRTSGNTYTVLRHGESISWAQNVMSTEAGDAEDKLTEKGKEESVQAAQELKKTKPDLIIASPFTRTRETALIVAEKLGIPSEEIVYDERLHEINAGVYDGRSLYEFGLFFESGDWFTKCPEGGESHADIRARVAAFIFDIEKTYAGKNILIVTHGAPAQMLSAVAARATLEQMSAHTKLFKETAEHHPLPFKPYPHNANFELDLHKPYIDGVVLTCEKCGNDMRRTPEVMDVWFDSGAMPFAQDHYPFENERYIDKEGFPADYICEAVDQTRGWFYTLHAIGVLSGKGHAYKNVICLGHILDSQGKKMSKSIGNVVNPWEAIGKWGVDTIRFWMFSVNQPGDTKNFDEKTIGEVNNKVFTLLRNVAKFYEMSNQPATRNSCLPAGTAQPASPAESDNVLDQWILALLAELVSNVTTSMDSYDMFSATRAIREFANDLSTWYVRRSRDRFKLETQMSANETRIDANKDREYALATFRFVLLELAKLLAPFTPFFAEEIYKQAGGEKESVHLEDWPTHGTRNTKHGTEILADMTEVRRIVSLALEARTNAGIKVRQPLASLKIRTRNSKLLPAGRHGATLNDLLDLVKDEVNVKQIIFEDSEGWEVELDTTITPELKEEGELRDLIRAIQDFRKQSSLTPSDKISVVIKTTKEGKTLIEKYAADIVSATTLVTISATDDLPEGEVVTVTLA
ncbi:MAG: class I tRNA ligase family protein [Candidatus Pacebacteria bacterium]|nr:class I tRNA ligase family protein [Candidatus Paceibacterota bacterium]